MFRLKYWRKMNHEVEGTSQIATPSDSGNFTKNMIPDLEVNIGNSRKRQRLDKFSAVTPVGSDGRSPIQAEPVALDRNDSESSHGDRRITAEQHSLLIESLSREIKTQSKLIDLLEQRLDAQVFENMSYPPAMGQPLSEEGSMTWLTGLEVDAMEISDLILKDLDRTGADHLQFKTSDRGDLDTLRDIIQTKNDIGYFEFRSDYLIRSIIAAGVSEWVFKDPYPELGDNKQWDEFETLFIARAKELAPLDDNGQALNNANIFVKRWRRYIIHSLSYKSQLIDQDLPERATVLAARLAKCIRFLVMEQKMNNVVPISFLNRNSGRKNHWMPRLEDLFLKALRFVVEMRQLPTRMELVWPERNAIFDGKSHMRPLNPGNCNSRGILLTIMPTAILGTKAKRGALVFLDISERVDPPQPSTHMKEAIAVGGAKHQDTQKMRTLSHESGRITGDPLSPVAENRSQKDEESAASVKNNLPQGTRKAQCKNCDTPHYQIMSTGLCSNCHIYHRKNRIHRPVGDICEECRTARIALTGWHPGAKRGGAIAMNCLPKQCKHCFLKSEKPEKTVEAGTTGENKSY